MLSKLSCSKYVLLNLHHNAAALENSPRQRRRALRKLGRRGQEVAVFRHTACCKFSIEEIVGSQGFNFAFKFR